jgi:hypothetical protein
MKKVNRQRANLARDTLSEIAVQANGIDVAIIDQIVNLLHLADMHGLNIQDTLLSASAIFTIEAKYVE